VKEVYTLADLEDWRQRADNDDVRIRLGVFGQPVAQSRSPDMQNAALKACGFAMRYARFEIAAEELPRAFEIVRRLDFVGVNLTMPHKARGMHFVDSVDEFARSVGAINTVRIDAGELVGTNTDGMGFCAAIRHDFGVSLRSLSVVVLGAGGAGRAIALQCAQEDCKRLVLVNRTSAKAQQLAADLQSTVGTIAEVVPWDAEGLHSAIANADLLVNATSLGMELTDRSPVPAHSLHANLMVYDTIYRPEPNPLLIAAGAAGARSADGLSMLLHQGALAFETWFARPAPLQDMAAALGL
jgi:shikimate dehydrogenase